jgi:hypothetical protein
LRDIDRLTNAAPELGDQHADFRLDMGFIDGEGYCMINPYSKARIQGLKLPIYVSAGEEAYPTFGTKPSIPCSSAATMDLGIPGRGHGDLGYIIGYLAIPYRSQTGRFWAIDGLNGGGTDDRYFTGTFGRVSKGKFRMRYHEQLTGPDEVPILPMHLL